MQIETHGGAGHARRPRRSKVYVKTIGDKTSMKIMVSFCPTFGGEICHNSEFRADDPRLQLGQVRRAEAAQAPGRLVPGPPPACKRRGTLNSATFICPPAMSVSTMRSIDLRSIVPAGFAALAHFGYRLGWCRRMAHCGMGGDVGTTARLPSAP